MPKLIKPATEYLGVPAVSRRTGQGLAVPGHLG
jgi:hypothetical protein